MAARSEGKGLRLPSTASGVAPRSRAVRVLELRSVWGTGGGPEKTILLGAAQTDRARYAVTVCYMRDRRDPVFGVTSRLAGLDLDYLEVLERHSFDPSIWPRLRRIVRERAIDIVHSHDYKTNVLALMLARFEHIVPLTTVHGWTGHSRRELALYYPVDKRVIARFPRVVAVSSEIRDELVRTGADPRRITVILNGIDASRFRRDRSREREVRGALGIPEDAVVVGAVGRLEPQKRFDLLLETIARLRPQYPRLFVAIAGDGSLRAELDAIGRRLGLDGHYRLLGHQPDVVALHHAFDLYVQSSKYEGTPNVVLEAMALESPIVATDVGGTAELVRHGQDGLIVPPNDIDALSAAIRGVLEHHEAALVRARSARQRVEGELSFATRMRRLEAIYDALAAGRDARAFDTVANGHETFVGSRL